MQRDIDRNFDAQLKALSSAFSWISGGVNAVLRETRCTCGIHHSDTGIEGVRRLKHHEAARRADHEGPIDLRISEVVNGQSVECPEHAILGPRCEREGAFGRQPG